MQDSIKRQERCYDFDWLRIFAFSLLIFYHTGLVFSYRWLVINAESSEAIIAISDSVSQWRMPLLFIISGLGVSFSLKRRSGIVFIKERFKRLFIPLVFGSLFINPPQLYFSQMFSGASMPSYLEFQLSIFNLDLSANTNLNSGHLWFLVYLLAFSIITLPILLLLRSDRGQAFIGHLIQILFLNKWLIVLLVVPLVCIEVISKYYLNGALFSGPMFLVYFIYGYIFFSNKKFAELILNFRKITLLLAVITCSVYLVFQNVSVEDGLLHFSFIKLLKSSNTLLWIFSIVSFAKKYLNYNHSILKYANEAVYPFYILHQPILVVFAFFIIRLSVSIPVKFFLISAGTFIITLIVYEFLIKRSNISRFLFGVKARRNPNQNLVLVK